MLEPLHRECYSTVPIFGSPMPAAIPFPRCGPATENCSALTPLTPIQEDLRSTVLTFGSQRPSPTPSLRFERVTGRHLALGAQAVFPLGCFSTGNRFGWLILMTMTSLSLRLARAISLALSQQASFHSA